MKSAKPAAAQGSSSRRSQPSRQARTNPSRHSHVRGSLGGRDTVAGGAAPDQPIDIFPAITHFADAITALPKELVRHITLLKEVDAKIYAPEDALFQLVDSAMRAPPAQPRPTTDAPDNVAPASAPMSVQNSSTGVATTGNPTAAPSMNGSQASSVVDSSNDLRRQLYQQTAFKIQEMLGSLEEKNHVISTANDALQKQLTRIEEVWPHVEGEFSDEAKWGSNTHWAYPENRAGNKAAHAERSRREGAAAISAAAQQLAEEAAARSDARKQAVQAKRNQKTQQQESDFDDPEGRGGKGEPANATNSTTTTTKKGGSKARKAAADVGLGISTNGTSSGSAPQPKRRKVEKAAAGNAPVERVMASASATDVPKAKTSSPRGTPAPEGQKKRKALPSGSTQSKKRNGAPAKPSSAASSPVVGSLPDPKQPRASPAPSQTKAPTASRARQNSVKSTVDNIMRPSSSASNKPNGAAPATPELPPATGWSRPSGESKATDVPAVIKTETAKKETMEAGEVGVILNATANNRKETPKQEEVERQNEPVAQTVTGPTVTKSGRASKPSTPALATFQEAARSRSARNSESKEPSGKRKKGGNNGNNSNNNNGSSSSNNGGHGGNGASNNTNNSNSNSSNSAGLAMAVQGAAARLGDEDVASSAQGDEEGEIDGDEPVYCYCNGVSYGEMVACDADDCEREWFHLECVGLKVAPKGNAKWYCEPCKKRLTASGKKINGR